MSWNTRQEVLTSDNYAYLGVFDSVADGSPTGGGVDFQCLNSTIMGFILDMPSNARLVQVASNSLPYDGGIHAYNSIAASFASSPTGLVIAVVTGIFQSALFILDATDDHSVPLTIAPYPNNGHVPGESNTLQIFAAFASDLTNPQNIQVNQIGVPTPLVYSPFTTACLTLLEYHGLDGSIVSAPSNFAVSPGPPSLTIPDASTNAGDLLLMAISIIQACSSPNVTPFGGGSIASPSGPGTRIPPNTLPVISLPFCFSEKCRIFQ